MRYLLSILLLIGTTQAHSTDWTPKFKPMTNGCGYLDLDYNLEHIYKSAILDKKTKVDSSEETEEQAVHQTIVFKNSIAFGQPIDRIKLESFDGSYSYTLYFKSKDIIKLRPLFKLPKLTSDEKKGITNNQTGYKTPIYSLKFNNKEKSITCSGYAG